MAKSDISADDLFVLRQEIKMAETLNEQELEPQIVEAVLRYTGKHVPELAHNWSIVLNEIYPVIQFNLPSIFFRNPRVFLKPRNKFFVAKRRNPLSGEMEEVQLDSTKSARTQEAILNYILTEIRYKDEVRKCLLDALLFKHGVLWHGYKGNFGMTEEDDFFIKDENVFVKRLNPMRFLKDPSVNMADINEGRWIARSFDIRLADLLEDDRLDIDKKAIKGKLGFGEKVGTKDMLDQLKMNATDMLTAGAKMRPLIDTADNEFKQSPGSRFVKVWEVFMRPTKKEARQGMKGRILLLTDEQKKPLRQNSWIYKAEGWPAKTLMLNYVPDQQFGIADVETYDQIADHKNLVINQQIRNAENLNKTIFALSSEGTSEEQITQLRNGENNIVTFDGESVSGKIGVVSGAGGSSNELYILDQRIDKNLQDKSGVSDLKRGFLQSGEESATSVRLRNAGSSARPAYRQDIMADFLKESAMFLNQLVKQFFPVDRAVRIIGSLDVEWSDSFTKEEIQAEVDAEIDVFSMLPEDPQKELQEIGQVLNLAIQAMSSPEAMQKLASENVVFNLKPIIETMLFRLKIRDPEIFRQVRPEESMGTVSVAELRAAQSNIQAAMAGQPPPSPPAEGQDHRARIEVMAPIAQVFQAVGQQEISQLLQQLIQLHTQLLEEQQAKENPRAGQRLRRTKPIGLQTSGNGVRGPA